MDRGCFRPGCSQTGLPRNRLVGRRRRPCIDHRHKSTSPPGSTGTRRGGAYEVKGMAAEHRPTGPVPARSQVVTRECRSKSRYELEQVPHRAYGLPDGQEEIRKVPYTSTSGCERVEQQVPVRVCRWVDGGRPPGARHHLRRSEDGRAGAGPHRRMVPTSRRSADRGALKQVQLTLQCREPSAAVFRWAPAWAVSGGPAAIRPPPPASRRPPQEPTRRREQRPPTPAWHALPRPAAAGADRLE